MLIKRLCSLFVTLKLISALSHEYRFEEVSIKDETIVLPDDGGTYNKWTGEFYLSDTYGDLNGDFVRYLFLSPDGYETKYFFFEDGLPEDPTVLDWNSADVSVLTRTRISRKKFQEYLLLRIDDGAGNVVYEGIKILPVRWNVTVNVCKHDVVELNITTSFLGRAVEDLIAPRLVVLHHVCPNNGYNVTSQFPSVIIDKLACGIGAKEDFSFVVATGPIVDDRSSQVFNITCSTIEYITGETGNVTDVGVTIDDSQILSEYAVPVMQFVNPLNNEQIIGEAFVGDNVRLLIQLPEEYRTNFDVKVIDCLVDDMYLLWDGQPEPQNFGFLPTPTKDQQGVAYMDFPLFRPATFVESYRLNMYCTVDTCLNSCDNNGGNDGGNKRKKRETNNIQRTGHLLLRAGLIERTFLS